MEPAHDNEITFEVDPSAYRHWELSVDAPVATVTLRVTPRISVRTLSGVPAPTRGEPVCGCRLVRLLKRGLAEMEFASLLVAACQFASVVRSVAVVPRPPVLPTLYAVPLPKRSL